MVLVLDFKIIDPKITSMDINGWNARDLSNLYLWHISQSSRRIVPSGQAVKPLETRLGSLQKHPRTSNQCDFLGGQGTQEPHFFEVPNLTEFYPKKASFRAQVFG